jgi:uncharacterized iron-regulated membrane protein
MVSRTMSVAGRARPGAVGAFPRTEGNTDRPHLRRTILVDAGSASLVSVRGYDSMSTSGKIRAWVRCGHPGEALGVFGRTVATLVSLRGVILLWTGIALARSQSELLRPAPSSFRGV